MKFIFVWENSQTGEQVREEYLSLFSAVDAARSAKNPCWLAVEVSADDYTILWTA